MSFFASLFACCGGNRKQAKAEAEARHGRIANIYSTDSTSSTTCTPPPRYADIALDRAVVVSDDKTVLPIELDRLQRQHQQHQQQLPRYPLPTRPPTASSRSSIISIPSTRLTDLTSQYTGVTRAGGSDTDAQSEQGVSWRDSGFYGSDESAPPSYYASSDRSVTPVPTPPPIAMTQHPVMQDNWLENLRAAAERSRGEQLPSR